jgi:membrane associated rhomboid family serine protease
MLYDRPYMREPAPERASPLAWLIGAMIGGFALQMALTRWFGAAGTGVVERLELTVHGLLTWHLWTLLTYGFFYSIDNPASIILQIAINVLVLYFLGRELLPMLGSRRFLGLCAAALIAGGLLWAATNWRQASEPMLGASSLFGATPVIAALMVVFACFFPNQEMTFLLAFIVPVRLKPKYIAGAWVLFDLFGFLFYEIRGDASPLGFAHSAHLGGMLAGWLYYRFVHDSEWQMPSRAADIELPRWLKRTPRREPAQTATYRVNLTNRADLRVEVDRILDKINSHGFGALTGDEKRLLDEARDLLSKR